ncbi:MAG: hypothetical protein HQL89_17470 [Magnetococcales bacterium]|nr:hypothetical protein [Magnetococcales bacterium]
MGAKAILMAMTESGLNFFLAGDVLRVTPRERITDETRNLIRAHKPELVALLRGMDESANQVTDLPGTKLTDHQESSPGRAIVTNQCSSPGIAMDTNPEVNGLAVDPDEDSYRKRSAIAEFDGGIPRVWAEGLARLCVMPRPEDISPRQWELIVKAAGMFADRWAAKAYSLGWTTEEVFGVHHSGPMVRFGSMGLVFLLADPRTTLESLDAEKATFLVGDREARQTFRRDTFNMDRSKTRLVWEPQKGG